MSLPCFSRKAHASMTGNLATCYSAVNSNLHVLIHTDLLSNALLEEGAMENKEIRRRNMLLLKGEGTLEELAKKTGSNPPPLSQINTGNRHMGEKLARRFEKRLRKPT